MFLPGRRMECFGRNVLFISVAARSLDRKYSLCALPKVDRLASRGSCVRGYSLVPVTGTQAGLVYSNEFNGAPGTTYPEWSSSGIIYSNRIDPPGSGILPAPVVASTKSPNNARLFLGLFGGPAIGRSTDPGWNRTRVDQTITLSLTNLPPHRELHLMFDLCIIRSWDGNSPTYGPDRFILNVGGGPTLLDTTFSNNPKTNSEGSFQNYPDTNNAPWTEALSKGTLGYDRFFDDAIYRLKYVFPHATNSVRINFSSSLFEGKGTSDEAWGLDNVMVWTDGSQ